MIFYKQPEPKVELHVLCMCTSILKSMSPYTCIRAKFRNVTKNRNEHSAI